ncbi:MAG: hypothetical protein GY754_20360 [bacterium]|nr:hypothetical protein [bacterium]
MKRKSVVYFIFLSLLVVFSINVMSCKTIGGLFGGSESEEAAEDEEEEGPPVPVVGLIPFDFTVSTGPGLANQALSETALAMVDRKTFKPASLREWMKENFNGGTARNIPEIVERAVQTDIKIDFVCHGKIFKSGSKYGVLISLYPVKPGIEPSYYYRSFPNFNTIMSVANEMVAEMETRATSKAKPFFNKSIFIENFNINFYTFTNLSSGERTIIPIPYITIDGNSYKSDNHFYNELLVYNFHITRLFTVWNSNMQDFTTEKPTITRDIDYVVSVDIDISKAISMLTVKVRGKKSKKTFTFKYPFKSLELDELYKLMRENTKNIILKILNDYEQKQVGQIKLDSLNKYQSVFCENFYLGEGKQFNLIFPAGTADLSISDERYKIFISPFSVSNKVFNLEDSFLLDLKK